MEAVKQGSATVGLKSKTHAVLVALKVRKCISLLQQAELAAKCKFHFVDSDTVNIFFMFFNV